MASEQLKRLIDKQNRLFNRMQDLQAQAREGDGEWSAEQRTNWDAANADIDIVSADIEREERMEKLAEVDYRQVIPTNDTPGGEATDESRAADYEEAFGQFVRGGMNAVKPEFREQMANEQAQAQRAYQSIGTPSEGGYLVPPGYRAVMTETLKAFGGLINHANVITTSTGNPLQWPTNDDTGNVGAILAENTQISELATTIGTRSIGAYTYTSKLVRVSLQLLQDSAFDVNTWLPKKLGERIGRAVADDLVNGTGIGEPTGLLPGSTAATIATTSSAEFRANTTGKGYNAVVDLEHSVDPAYRQAGSCRYVFADSTLAILRKITDSQLRPLWLPIPTPGFPATINGLPYTIDQAVPAQSTTSKFMMFGDFNAGYIVRQALDVQMVRLAERYADYLQVGFFGFMRLDATPDDTAAVRHLALSS